MLGRELTRTIVRSGSIGMERKFQPEDEEFDTDFPRGVDHILTLDEFVWSLALRFQGENGGSHLEDAVNLVEGAN